MMPIGTPQQVFALRQQLWDAGFRPVPIYSPDASHDAAGKAPRGADWGDKARQDPPVAAVAPPTPDALNTGILCDGLRAIDIDVDNPTIAHSIRAKCLAMFGETAMRYRANSPRALLVYRAAEGTPAKRVLSGTFGKIEVLGRGQQFVGFGVHPSGADLQWMPEAPGEIDVGSLRAVTEDEITALLEACAPSIGADAAQARAAERPPTKGDRKLGADALQVVAALCAIPNTGPADWEAWNRIGMATYAATSGNEAGRAAFHAWSQQHPSYDADETNARWDHYADSPPTQIGAGTLFYLARENQRQNDDGPPPPPDEAYWEALGAEAPHAEPSIDPPSSRPGLPVLYFEEIERSVDVRDFVQGLLVEQSSAVLYGESNSGKTFFATWLAMAIASGMTWFGRRVEQGGVLYLALEGGQGFRNRIAAWRERHDALAGPVYFAAIPSQVNLLHPDADMPRVIAAARDAAERMGVGIKLIVVDTLARAMAGGNENAPEDMGALVMNMDRIRAETGAAVLFIHHSGKDAAKGARGHSSLRAAIDTEIEVEATDGPVRRATVVKQRDMRKGDVFAFELEVVELGENRHGEAVTTCLVREVEQAGAKTKRESLSGRARLALDVLHEVVGTQGLMGAPDTPENVASVPDEVWRRRFYDRLPSDGDVKQNAKRMAFNRAAEELQTKRMVATNRGRVWVVRPD